MIGIVFTRQIQATIKEVAALTQVCAALSDALKQAEDRIAALEQKAQNGGNRQRRTPKSD